MPFGPFQRLGKIAIFRRMERAARHNRIQAGADRDVPPTARLVARGEDWSVSEFTCTAGPHDRPFEEARDGYTIAAVLEGSFTYRADNGVALLHPGALLLGNDRMCFECGHDHSAGDRCIAFNFSPELFCEIASRAAGTSRYKFSAPKAPADKRSIPMLALVEAITRDAAPLHVEEIATRLFERVVAALSGHGGSSAAPSRRETRRIADVLAYIEAQTVEPVDLATLAALANLSKYHFLRVFRRMTGMTPHQYLLGARMRRAALRLADSSETVASIAFESGFGDLSTFNNQFRRIFGVSPTAYRSAIASATIVLPHNPTMHSKRL